MASICRLCKRAEENLEHLIWSCPFSTRIWRWIATLFGFNRDYHSFKQAIDAGRRSGEYIHKLWTAAVLASMVSVWKHHNAIVFEEEEASIQVCQQLIRRHIAWSVVLIDQKSNYRDGEMQIIQRLGLKVPPKKHNHSKQVIWVLPSGLQVKGNIDGSSLESPVLAGIRISFRDSSNKFL